jgi:integrase/recombinase XerD
MNQSPPGLKLSQCIEGFILYKSAEGLRPRTLQSYRRYLDRWAENLKDPLVEKITPKDVRQYLDFMRNDYVPQRISGNKKPLSPKSIRNIWMMLSSFFTWATVEFQIPNPMDQVPAPRYKLPPVEPFKKEETEVILLEAPPRRRRVRMAEKMKK